MSERIDVAIDPTCKRCIGLGWVGTGEVEEYGAGEWAGLAEPCPVCNREGLTLQPTNSVVTEEEARMAGRLIGSIVAAMAWIETALTEETLTEPARQSGMAILQTIADNFPESPILASELLDD